MSASDRDEALKELGRMARERREDVRLSLEDIFERTRVRVEFLRGIEEGNYQGFPDIVYVKGFVRTYLSVVGAEDLKDEFVSWLNKSVMVKVQDLPPTNVLGNSTFPTKGFKPVSHFWLFVVLILVLAGSGGYVWYSWANSPMVPGRIFDPGTAVAGIASFDEPTSKDPSSIISPDQNLLTILPTSASVVPAPEPKPKTPSLYVKAKMDVWMKVTIADKIVFSKTLPSGSEASWDLPSRAKVTYGRPNAVEVILNGKELGVPNPKGSKTAETYFYETDGTHRRVQ
jgi:cytoskeletal protein RodZ